MDLYNVVVERMSQEREVNFYVLLDCAGLPGIKEQLAATSVISRSLFNDSANSGVEEGEPAVLLIGAENRVLAPKKFLKWIQENGAFSSSIVMLTSSLNFESMRVQLAERLDVSLAGSLQAMLRFYDPRVLEALASHLNDVQRRWFFKIADIWWYVNRTGHLVQFEAEYSEDSRFNERLVLTQEQEDSLIRESEVDQIIFFLRSNLNELMMSIPVGEQYWLVQESIHSCRSDGTYSVSNVACRVAELLISEYGGRS